MRRIYATTSESSKSDLNEILRVIRRNIYQMKLPKSQLVVQVAIFEKIWGKNDFLNSVNT